MNRSEKIVGILAVLSMAVFFFAILMSRAAGVNTIPQCIPVKTVPYTRGKVVELVNNHYQVFCVAGMWQFDPAVIEVPVGSTVDLYLTSKDVVHGFNIWQYNVNMTAVYGAVNLTTVTFDRKGEFAITCHEYCGVGHQFMQGKVIVK